MFHSICFDRQESTLNCSPRDAAEDKNAYVTREDLCKLFTEDVNGLYLLSFLLTANHEKAERCFVAGLDDCVDGNPIFHHWAHAWARRVIVRNAIRIILHHAVIGRPIGDAAAWQSQDEDQMLSVQDVPFASVLALEDRERFAYVLSVLERYPERDCATLLDASTQEIREAVVSAREHVANGVGACAALPDALV